LNSKTSDAIGRSPFKGGERFAFISWAVNEIPFISLFEMMKKTWKDGKSSLKSSIAIFILIEKSFSSSFWRSSRTLCESSAL
jgi:hypothetical protein